MKYHVIIDGNNLLHAMFDDARIRTRTRVALVDALRSWARRTNDDVTLVFDGPTPTAFDMPNGGPHIDIRYSAPETADDVIVRIIHAAANPDQLRVVSSDGAIRYEARRRRGTDLTCADFITELFPERRSREDDMEDNRPPEKPTDDLSRSETDQWLAEFGLDDDEEEGDDGLSIRWDA